MRLYKEVPIRVNLSFDGDSDPGAETPGSGVGEVNIMLNYDLKSTGILSKDRDPGPESD